MKQLFIMMLMAVACGSAVAQPVRELSPEASIELALRHSRDLHIARDQAEESAARFREARATRFPALTSQASYQRLSSNIPDFSVTLPSLPGAPQAGNAVTLAPAILDRYALQVSVQQPVFTGFRLENSIRAAEWQAEAAVQGVAQAMADLVLQVEQAYWALVRAQALQGVADLAVEQVGAHLQDILNIQANGMATSSDVLSVQTRLSEVQLKRVEADNMARMARLNLNFLTGLPLESEVRPSAAIEPKPLAEPVEALVARALSNRPELAGLEAQAQALGAGIAVAKSGRYPQVFLSGAYRYARPNQFIFPPADQFNGTWDVGVAVSFDLWNWGRTGAQVQQAQARQDQAERRLEQMRDLVRLEVNRRYLDVQRALEAVQVARQGVQAAEESYRVTRQRFGQGVALNAEVLDAEGAFRDAETRYQQMLADYAVARAELRHAVGNSPAP